MSDPKHALTLLRDELAAQSVRWNAVRDQLLSLPQDVEFVLPQAWLEEFDAVLEAAEREPGPTPAPLALRA